MGGRTCALEERHDVEKLKGGGVKVGVTQLLFREMPGAPKAPANSARWAISKLDFFLSPPRCGVRCVCLPPVGKFDSEVCSLTV